MAQVEWSPSLHYPTRVNPLLIPFLLNGIVLLMNWKDFFDSLGMDGTKWQWRIMRWEKAWKDRKETLRQKKGQVTYQHKFCRSCGALIDRDEKTCPHCGSRAPSWRVQVVSRALGLVMPSALSVSGTLLVVNTLLFLVLVAIVGGQALVSPPLDLMTRMGALVLSHLAEGAYGTLITYGYLHSGIMHFAFNMLVLSQVGPMLEEEIGRSRFFTIYTLALIGGGLARYFFSGPLGMVVVGASGGLFGLIGFGMAYAHALGTSSALQLRSFFARWAVIGFVAGLLIGADNVAHSGGFIVGVLAGFAVERERVSRERLTRYWNIAAWTCATLTVVAFGMII